MNAASVMSRAVLCASVIAVLFLGMGVAAVVGATSAREAGTAISERCVIEVPAQTYEETREWVKRIEGTGAMVTVVGSPRMMLCRATANQITEVRVQGATVYGAGEALSAAAHGGAKTRAERALFRIAAETEWPTSTPIDEQYLEHLKTMEQPPFSVELTDETSRNGKSVATPPLSASVTEAADYDGYSDFMTGEIAVALFLFESDGTIDPDAWDWTEADVDSVVNNATAVFDTMVYEAAVRYATNLTWYVLLFEPTDDRMQIPWQSQYHKHYDEWEGWTFQVDTVPGKIYDNLGLSGTGGLLYGNNPRPYDCNIYLADSVGVPQGLHHFVQQQADTCWHPKPITSGFYQTVMQGKAVFWDFKKFFLNEVEDTCCTVTASSHRKSCSHENAHAFGAKDYSACDHAVGDRISGDRVKRQMNYSEAYEDSEQCFPNFVFDSCTMGGRYARLCLSTARQVGWWGHDFGDAPDPYPSLKSDDGAAHLIGSFEWLGGATASDGFGDVTYEIDADSTTADFIDHDPRSNLALINADCHDDGVVFSGHLNPGSLDTFQVTIANHGVASYRYFDEDTGKLYLNAWFDWNGDGDWDDAGEQIVDSYSWIPDDDDDLTKTVDFTMTPPADYADTIWARFRLDYGEDCGAYERIYSDASLAGPEGIAVYGEVEDYYFTDGYPWNRGDINRDGAINPPDMVLLVVYVYQQGPPPDPLELGDINCDGSVNPLDVVLLGAHIYGGGAEPCCSH